MCIFSLSQISMFQAVDEIRYHGHAVSPLLTHSKVCPFSSSSDCSVLECDSHGLEREACVKTRQRRAMHVSV